MSQNNEQNPAEEVEVESVVAADNSGDVAAAEFVAPAVPPAPSITPEPAQPYRPAAYASAPSYPMPAEAKLGEPAAKSSKLGIIAFYASLAGLVFGGVILWFAGYSLGDICSVINCADPNAINEDLLLQNTETAAFFANSALLMIVGFFVWGGLSLWGLIQGIIAMVQKRGRGWGLAALLIAVLGAIPVFGIYTIAAGVAMAPYIVG